MIHNSQEKFKFYPAHVLILAIDPSKSNIETAARAYAQMSRSISREEARVVIATIQEAEANNSRNVGEQLLRIIDSAFENIRRQMLRTC